ncbi:MAG: polysaccharide deacetylase family protein [Deltaproteobacteria bacterium]|nr:polysaccharide deacetylase family protein [Deltaproteobacteria bacterium]
MHGITVDVEDWFHVLEAAEAPQPAAWARQESRVAANTLRLLDLFDGRGVRATFFCLGWVAETVPDLIGEIARRGHEIGSHGHLHQLIGELGRDGFARDLDRSLEALHKAGAGAVRLFRAPGFSLGKAQGWALPVLVSRGITVDASMFLARRAHGGYALKRRRPFDVVLPDGRTLTEAPTVPLYLGDRALPFAGGGYLRLLPWPALRACWEAAQWAGNPVLAYVHPREIDPGQPRMPLSAKRRFKYYVGLSTTLPKLERLLGRYRFGSIGQVIAAHAKDHALHLDAEAVA